MDGLLLPQRGSPAQAESIAETSKKKVELVLPGSEAL